MHHSFVQPDAFVAECLREGQLWERACEWGQQWKKALDVLTGSRQSLVQPNVICFNSAFRVCGQGQQWKKALDLLSGMLQSLVQPHTISFNLSISACNEWGQQWKNVWRCSL